MTQRLSVAAMMAVVAGSAGRPARRPPVACGRCFAAAAAPVAAAASRAAAAAAAAVVVYDVVVSCYYYMKDHLIRALNHVAHGFREGVLAPAQDDQ